jgi:hypothetical protein
VEGGIRSAAQLLVQDIGAHVKEHCAVVVRQNLVGTLQHGSPHRQLLTLSLELTLEHSPALSFPRVHNLHEFLLQFINSHV